MESDKVKQLQHAEFATLILSDISPELALRWINAASSSARPTSLPPALYRAVISTILRATTRSDALDALHALERAVKLPPQTPAAYLGFTSETQPHIRALVLQDIILSAARDDPLLPEGDALSFYSNAGQGSGDAAEFSQANPAADGRPAFVSIVEPLPEIRRDSLVHVLRLFASLVARDQVADLIPLAVRRAGTAVFIAPYTDTLLRTVDTLNPHVVSALHVFYAAAISALDDAGREETVTRLVGAIMSVAQDHPANIGLFLTGMRDAGSLQLLFDVCRVCLVQRFRVRDSPDRPLSLARLVQNFLSVGIVTGRANDILPALLTGLIFAWINTGSFPERMNPNECVHRVKQLHDINIDDKLFEKVDAPQRDVIALNVAVMDLVQHLLCASGHDHPK